MFGRKQHTPKESNPCPVCGFLTLGKRGIFDICPVCFWEDDGDIAEAHPDQDGSGANGDLTLSQAKQNFADFGAVEKRLLAYVVPPTAYQLPGVAEQIQQIADRQENARARLGVKREKI